MKCFLLALVCVACLAAAVMAQGSSPANAPDNVPDNPVEIGAVQWGRDLGVALEQSSATGKPVLVLFQEVPGCAGCQDFGQTVLSSPLLVEAIETEFLPVFIYNNRPGKDAELLERYKEPSWNYQVIRFLDGAGNDIIPRKDRVWTLGGVAARMIETLEAAQRPVPKYLEVVAVENGEDNLAESAFAMYCFWTGEMELGKLDGVVSTEAGFLEGHEVTRVVYDKRRLDLATLAARARQSCSSTKVYAIEGATHAAAALGDASADAPIGKLDGRYRKAPASDQAKQLERRRAILSLPGLTAMQRTKLNAFAPVSEKQMLMWLSPRQRAALGGFESAAAGAADPSR